MKFRLFALVTLCPFIPISLSHHFLLAEEPTTEQGATSQTLEPNFERDILPILSQAGCNAASCHGASGGRGGLALSLFGARPQDDYQTLVFGESGRRIQWNEPRQSLLLTKPATVVNHEGDLRFDVDSPSWQRIERWIAAGTPYGSRQQITHLEVEPQQVIAQQVITQLAAPHSDDPSGNQIDLVPIATAKLKIWAIDSQGSRHDVTLDAVIEPDDPTGVTVRSDRTVSSQRQGETLLFIRYASRYAVVRLIVPYSQNAHESSASNDISNSASSPIDTLINQQLETLKLPLAPVASSDQQIRRVTLDLAGRLPTPSEALEFQSDSRPDAWHRQVDRLLASPEFDQLFSFRMSRWLSADTAGEPPAAKAFRQWLTSSIADDRPWSELVQEMLTARGDSHQVGPAGFYRSTADPRLQAEQFAEQILGSRLRCANCHDHPLDRWTQDDYHGLAAIFAKVSQARIVSDRPNGSVMHPRELVAASPKLLAEINGDQRLDTTALAQWLQQNEFAQSRVDEAQVNRIWGALMGNGLVHSIDDWRDTNPASHPQLLALLTELYQSQQGRLRPLVRRMVLTDVYRRSSSHSSDLASEIASEIATPVSADPLAARWHDRTVRRDLNAELLWDAIVQVTGVPGELVASAEARSGSPPEAMNAMNRSELAEATQVPRAIDLIGRAETNPSLSILGRCPINESCDPSGEPSSDRDLRQGLHWINGPLTLERLSDPQGSLLRSWQSAVTPEAWLAPTFHLSELRNVDQPVKIRDDDPRWLSLDGWYLTVYSRLPTDSERQFWIDELTSTNDPVEAQRRLIDLAWANLATQEFWTRP